MSERFEKGRKVLKQINDDSIEDIFKGLEGIAPVLGRFIVEYPYSEIYTRETVDLKKRELCTIAALTVMGFPQGELKAHVRGNLAAGNSPEEIIEVIIQMSAYGGFPAAINAVNTAKEVFEERNLLPLKISEADAKMERKETNANYVVIAATDDDTKALVPALLEAKPSTIVLDAAGRYKEEAEAWQAAGLNGFIHAGQNIVDKLQQVAATLGEA